MRKGVTWQARLPSIHRRLLGWYAREHRPLPWRHTSDAYAILLSEIMLQQTQVERVIPKYLEFLKRYPSFERLAAAPVGDVIRTWGRLGYNRRTVRLHRLARLLVEQYRGQLPESPEQLSELEGLGPYTSAAVACFAFGRQVAAVDTNVRRVLQRLLADAFENDAPTASTVAVAAREALPDGRAADWNQALMDLGATICTARAPACNRCPVMSLCAAPSDAAGPQSRPERAAEQRLVYRADRGYVGSSRFYRGRIVDRLRALRSEEDLGLDELGGAVRHDFGPEHRPWLLELLRTLAAEGLVLLEGHEGLEIGSGEKIKVRLP